MKHQKRLFIFFSLTATTKLPELTTTVKPSTTAKPSPCEIPKKSLEKPEDKLEEKTPEKKDSTTTTSTTSSTTTTLTTTKKPVIKWGRQKRSAVNQSSSSSKRCIHQQLNSPLSNILFHNSILGAANPKAAESSKEKVRYARSVDLVSQNIEPQKSEDSLTEESMLQGAPLKQQRSIKLPFGDGSSRLNFFNKLSLKTENLLHGNVINSIESNELHSKSAEADSSQSDSTKHPHVVKPTSDPPSSNIPVYRPEDYLPSYEYFPRNPQPSFNPPQYYPQPQEASQGHQKFVVGPNSFKSTPLYEKNLGEELAHVEDVAAAIKAVEKAPEVAVAVTAPTGCRCDPEHFNELLHHMQSSYQQFHNGMLQLFNTFQSQSNCGSSSVQRERDSSSSPSHSTFDYRSSCRDKNHVNSDPQLALKCRGAFDDANVNPSGGYFDLSHEMIPSGGFKNQFLTFSDYTKMMRNVNTNSGTLMSGNFEMDDQIVGAAQKASDDNGRDETVKHLKQHINEFKEPVVAAPEPVTDDPTVAAAQETSTVKFAKLDMKALLGNLRRKN